MSNTSNNTKRYNLPSNGTHDLDLEHLRRGITQEIKGLREQLIGKQQQLNALDRYLGREDDRER